MAAGSRAAVPVAVTIKQYPELRWGAAVAAGTPQSPGGNHSAPLQAQGAMEGEG